MKYLSLSLLGIALLAGFIGPGAVAADSFSAGLVQFNAGRWQQASDLFVQAASEKPDDVVRRITAGVALANLKLYGPAVEQFEAASCLAPDAALPVLLLSGVKGEMRQANVLKTQQAPGLSQPGQWHRRNETVLEKALSESVARYPSNSIAQCLLGDLAQLRGLVPEARQRYHHAAELAPSWPKPMFNLGIAALQANPEVARASFLQVTRMDPSNSRAYLWLGDAYSREGNVEQAIASYEQAAKDEALMAEARTRIASAQMQAGNYVQAVQDFALAEKQAPDDVRPVAGQGQVLHRMGKPKEAEKKFSQAARLSAANEGSPSSQAYLQNQIGVVQAEQGRLGEAVANLLDAFQLHPTNANAYALASAQHQAGQLDASIEQYEKTVQSDPNDRTANAYLLAAYQIKGDAARVSETAETLARLDAANAWMYLSEIGKARARLGDPAGARNAFERSLDAGNVLTWNRTAADAAGCGVVGQLLARYSDKFDRQPDRRTGLMLFELRIAARQFESAANVARSLAAADPDDLSLWLRVGQATEQSGSIPEAMDAYRRAADSSNPEAAALARARLQVLQDK